MPKDTILEILFQCVQDGTCFISLLVVSYLLCSLCHVSSAARCATKPSGQREDGKVVPSLRVREHAELREVCETEAERSPC